MAPSDSSDEQLNMEILIVTTATCGIPTDSMREVVIMLAQYEGILLDPVYSGKGMAGLIDLVRSGHFKKGENVVFLHINDYK